MCWDVDLHTPVVCRCCLNSSIVVLEIVMSRNIPSSLEVNWHPHSVWTVKRKRKIFNNISKLIKWKYYKFHTYEMKSLKIFFIHFTWTHFQLGDHIFLRIVRYTFVGKQSAGKVLLVVPLKYILFLHETKQHHGFVQYRLYLLLCQLDIKVCMMNDCSEVSTTQITTNF